MAETTRAPAPLEIASRAAREARAFFVIFSAIFCGCGPSSAVVGNGPRAFPRPAASTDGGASDALEVGAPSSLSPFLADWPRIRIGVESRQFSSFDRTGGNDDGFSGTYSELYADANGEHVIFDAVGPGRLNTLWFTSAVSGTAPLGLGRVRLYLDDAATPALDVDADQLFAGGVAGFPASLVFDNHRSTGGFVSTVPVVYARRLKITTEKKGAFYSAQYETFPADQAVVSWTPGDDPSAAVASFGAPVREDGETEDEVPLESTHLGPGLVTRLEFRPDGQPAPELLRAARVRIFWEDETEPGVDCPMDAFFGSGLGEAPVSSIAFTMAPGRWANHMPMPFWRRARFQITGVAGRLFLRIEPNPYDAARAAHLRVAWRQERPTTSPDDFEYLTYAGAGRLVATVLTVEPPDAARDKQWWEGDLRSSADGRRTPGLQGTGYEDDHFGGWSNEFFSTPFSLPLHGEPRAQLLDPTGQFNGNVTMYRVWRGIPFTSEIRHSVEHGTENNRAVDESAATFFYGEPRAATTTTDTLDLCDAASRTAHALVFTGPAPAAMLTSAFEGRDHAAVTHCHVTQTGSASFVVQVTSASLGLSLRRWFDQAKGRQSARVSVDGHFVGRWYTAESNVTARWAERDFFVPGSLLPPASSVTVTIDPDADGLWDAAEYRAISVLPPVLP